MTKNGTHPLRDTTGQEMTAVKVLVMYEDLACGLRAASILDRLRGQSGIAVRLTEDLWQFDMLRPLSLREEAAIEAASVDIIILSVSGSKELPWEVQEWMARWLEHKEDRPDAMGVLLDPKWGSQVADNPVIASIRRFADAAGMEFFCSSSKTTAAGADAMFNEIRERTTVPPECRMNFGTLKRVSPGHTIEINHSRNTWHNGRPSPDNK